jgi:hypothetical protein
MMVSSLNAVLKATGKLCRTSSVAAKLFLRRLEKLSIAGKLG